jgi:hypothetical protein
MNFHYSTQEIIILSVVDSLTKLKQSFGTAGLCVVSYDLKTATSECVSYETAVGSFLGIVLIYLIVSALYSHFVMFCRK